MAQRPFREYPAWEYNNFPLPKDYMVPGEWTFARLMYPTTHYRIDWQSEYKRGLDWRDGNTNWTIDYPRSDRHLALAIRRLTRIDARGSSPVATDLAIVPFPGRALAFDGERFWTNHRDADQIVAFARPD